MIATASFADHFGQGASGYAAFRPHYPPDLYEYLASLAPVGRVWDCACGSGQATAGLANKFSDIVATDASARQINAAAPLPGVEFRVADATASGLGDASCSLVTVAQALHWFASPAFFAEAWRVLQPGGVLVAWSYQLCKVSGAVDPLIEHLFVDLLGDFWPDERRLVDRGYADISLPGTKLMPPEFVMTAEWTAEQMLGYLATWSALRRAREATGTDPLARVAVDLKNRWPTPTAVVRWPLVVIAAQKV
ncbi:MAG: class I SAM-dependent methyltransferase [Pseudomonadota bacterium]